MSIHLISDFHDYNLLFLGELSSGDFIIFLDCHRFDCGPKIMVNVIRRHVRCAMQAPNGALEKQILDGIRAEEVGIKGNNFMGANCDCFGEIFVVLIFHIYRLSYCRKYATSFL